VIAIKCQLTPIAIAMSKILIYKLCVPHIAEASIPIHKNEIEKTFDLKVMPLVFR
jgi:hypothetical protein